MKGSVNSYALSNCKRLILLPRCGIAIKCLYHCFSQRITFQKCLDMQKVVKNQLSPVKIYSIQFTQSTCYRLILSHAIYQPSQER